MKSTYKLLSIYLDGKPLPTKIPKTSNDTNVSEYYEFDEEINIFDFPICRRKVSGLKLLSFKSEDDVLEPLKLLPNCQELMVVLDYNSTGNAAYKLYLKRVLQSVYLIMKKYPNLTISFVGNNTDSLTIKKIYEEHLS